jgi:hypothetical protein
MPHSVVRRMASAQSAPVPVQYLLRLARKGAEALYRHPPDIRARNPDELRLLGAMALHNAFSEALFSNVQIREKRDLYCEIGPPVCGVGEDTKKRIMPNSPQHAKTVARSFLKILNKRHSIQLARKIVFDNWEPTLS